MPTVRFGEWLPDQAEFSNPGVLIATNVYPSATGYLPVSSFTPSTDALDDYPRGAIQLYDKDLVVYQFAGDEEKLYVNEDNEWVDVSQDGGYSTGEEESWEFTQWLNFVIATNYSDPIQIMELGDDEFDDLTTDFRARHIAVVRDFLVAGNTVDSADDERPGRIRWSAFGDPYDWTVSPSTGADFRDLPGGTVERIFGGEFGVIFQRNSVFRMSFVGTPTFFQLDEVLPGIGLIAPGAAARDGDTIYFLSDRGFFSLVNGTQAAAIGAEKVDRYVLNELDISNAHRISCVVDPKSNRVFWAYPGQGSSDGSPNKIICFDRILNRWTLINQPVELLWQAGGLGFTLDGLDSVSDNLDELPASLDSRRWTGGAPFLGAFDADFRGGFFDGDPYMAEIEGAETEINQDARTTLGAFRPIIDGDVTASVGFRNDQSDPVQYTDHLSKTSSGRITCRVNARYHRLHFHAQNFTNAVGYQIEAKDAKREGTR